MSLRQDLRSFFPDDRILDDASSFQQYGRDWTKFYPNRPSAVVFAVNAEELQRLVQWARKKKVGLVPSGGRTGLSGGACATNGEIVVSFEKMNRILEYNSIDRMVRVEPGVITEALQTFAMDQGAFYPVDFAARGSSQIGGNIATNAGGIRVLRYGATRDWVAGLKVVTGTGELLDLNRGLIKNATGFDLRHLFIGSEGTLGFITEATIKLTRIPKPSTVLILGLSSLDAVMKVFEKFRQRLDINAFEFFSDVALRHVVKHSGLPEPFPAAGRSISQYVLVEIENTGDRVDEEIADLFESCTSEELVLDGSIAKSESQARDFWRLREDISEATSRFTPYKNDVSVQISKVPEFLRQTDEALKRGYPDFEVVWFGHIGDGNMHINILKPDGVSAEQFLTRCKGVNATLFKIIAGLGGSISAEHGVGLVKRDDLQYSRSPAEIGLMKEIKETFDPDGILNPGKLFKSIE